MIILFPPRSHLIFFLILLSTTLARAFQTTQNSLSQTLSISPSQNRPSHQPRNFIISHSEELQSPNNRRVAARVRSSQSDQVTPPSASTLTATPTTAWKSCPQPRFDEFASSIIGPWTVISSSSTASPFPPTSTPISSSSFTDNKRYEVEEVMRSCGGAVQGIREFPLSCIFPEVAIDDDGAMAEERTYHNRADGGFVYFDDGSYSAGLERWDWGSMMADEYSPSRGKTYPKLMMASLAFPNRRRVWVTATLSELSSAASAVVGEGAKGRIEGVACTAMDLVRPTSTSTSKESERAEKSDTIEDSMVSALPPSIQWKSIQRVRMSSASQSWSLPRAKWECKVESSEGEGSSNDATKSHLVADLGESTMDCWAFVECMPEDDGIFGDMIADDGHVNMHMVAVCSTSNMARSVVRHYDTNGMLKSVAFLDGILVLNEDE